MIQSGLLPNTRQQLISWMIETREKAIGGVMLLSNTVEMKITPWIACEWNARQGRKLWVFICIWGSL
jgi:hypothetical protein